MPFDFIEVRVKNRGEKYLIRRSTNFSEFNEAIEKITKIQQENELVYKINYKTNLHVVNLRDDFKVMEEFDTVYVFPDESSSLQTEDMPLLISTNEE